MEVQIPWQWDIHTQIDFSPISRITGKCLNDKKIFMLTFPKQHVLLLKDMKLAPFLQWYHEENIVWAHIISVR